MPNQSFKEPYEFLCSKGHRKIMFLEGWDATHDACNCGYLYVWYNNMSPDYYMLGFKTKLKLKRKNKYKVCSHCGHKKLIKEKTYHIPTDFGTRI